VPRNRRGDGQNQLDAIVAPTGGVTGKTDLIYGERGAGGSSSIPAMAGYPNITVPAAGCTGCRWESHFSAAPSPSRDPENRLRLRAGHESSLRSAIHTQHC